MVLLFASALLGTVLVAAGVTKVGRVSATAEAAGRLVPALGAVPRRVLAQVLPPTEILVGVALIVGVWRPEAGAAAVVLLAGFTVAMLVALLHGRDVRCGCFGEASQRPVSWWTIARNASLLSCAAFVWSAGGNPNGLSVSEEEVAALFAATTSWTIVTLISVGGRTYLLMRRLTFASGVTS